MAEKINIFLDMDNTLVDTLPVLNKAVNLAGDFGVQKPDQIPGIFRHLPPVKGAVEAVRTLQDSANLHILTTAPWNNPSSWSDKLKWLADQFGNDEQSPFFKKVTMAHEKDVARANGGILVDDRPYHGAAEWDSESHKTVWIQYGYDERLTWDRDLPAFLKMIANVALAENLNAREAVERVNQTFGYTLHDPEVKIELENWEK